MTLEQASSRIAELEKENELLRQFIVEFRRAVDNDTIYLHLTRDPDHREHGSRLLDKLRAMRKEADEKERAKNPPPPIPPRDLTLEENILFGEIQRHNASEHNPSKSELLSTGAVNPATWTIVINGLLNLRRIERIGAKKGARYRVINND